MTSNAKFGLLGIVFSTVAAVVLPGSAAAQFPLFETSPAEKIAQAPATLSGRAVSDPKLVDSIPSSSDQSAGQPTAAEIRQARAQYRSQQRLERMERNLWAGYEPLRPNWNAIPMMSTRYPSRNTIYVPIYVAPW